MFSLIGHLFQNMVVLCTGQVHDYAILAYSSAAWEPYAVSISELPGLHGLLVDFNSASHLVPKLACLALSFSTSRLSKNSLNFSALGTYKL